MTTRTLTNSDTVEWDESNEGELKAHVSAGSIGITAIASAAKTGADSTLVTGTAGTDGNVAVWNSDGDVVDGGLAAADILTDSDIGVEVQAYSANLDSWSAEDPSDYYTKTEIDAAFQPLDADLTAIAALSTQAAGRSVLTISDPGADRIVGWDDSAGTMKAFALEDIATEESPATGDYVLIYGAEGDLRKVDWDDLPAEGLGDVVGPGSATDGNLVAFDGETGKLVKDSNIATSAVVTLDGTQTLTNKTIDGDDNTIQDVPTSALKDRTGQDDDVVTGTAGTSGNLVAWDANGDAVDANVAASAVVTASSTTTFTNKTFDANGTGNSLSNVEVADFAASAIVTEAEGIASNDNDSTIPTSAAVKDYVDDNFQPLDADLTAIAALSTQAAGRSVLTIDDPGADRLVGWDDSAGTMKAFALTDIATEESPATGDYVLIYGAEGDLRKVDWDDLPAGDGGGGGGSGDVVGPGSATDGNLVAFDGETGKLVKDSNIATSAVVTLDGTQTLTNKTIDGDDNTIQDIPTSALKDRTGQDDDVVTGTAGTDGNVAVWNSDGDVVDGGLAAADILTDSDIGDSVQGYDAGLADIAGLSITKGNVIIGDGTNWKVLGVGSNGQVLTADSSESLGIKWATPGGGGGSGDVTGPGSSTAGNLASFADETGKVIEDSSIPSASVLRADTSDDLEAGFTATSSNQGTKSSGTFTPSFATRNIQHCVNDGSFALGVPTGHGSLVLDITNGSSAGAIDTDAYDLVTGDEFTTTEGDKFRCFITTGDAGSHLHVVAFQ